MDLIESAKEALAAKNEESPLKLKATHREFTLEDKSGYKFRISTNRTRDGAWGALLQVHSEGMMTEDAALDMLLTSAKHFVRMMEER